MRFSGIDLDDHGPWFRLGQVDVNTTNLILGLWLITLVIFAVEPPSLPVDRQLFLVTDNTGFELWRYVTWPFAHVQFGLGQAISAGIFWLFGTQLEREVGRRGYLTIMGSALLIIPIVGVVISAIFPWATGLADLDLFGLVLVLLFIADRPGAMFFLQIPAWVIGAVIVGLEVINDVHDRDWTQLLTVVIAGALIALVARTTGLLTRYERIPDVSDAFSRPRLGRKRGASKTKDAPGAYSQPDPFAQNDRKPGRGIRKRKNDEPAEIVPMPPQPRRRAPIETSVDDVSVDDIALDLLLDKIADGGMDSLTADERQALNDLRTRRRSK